MLQRINIFDINAVHPVIYVRVSILHVKNTSNYLIVLFWEDGDLGIII
jgi:hypothetical protein